MRLICLGCGDAHSARWYSSCLALEAEGTRLLIDCPHPIRKILRESSRAAGEALDVGDFAAVVQTHLHADHASGLEGWGFFWHFALKRPAILLAHPEVLGPLWDRHLGASMGALLRDPAGPPIAMAFTDYFDARPLSEAAPTTFGPFAIECRRTIHHIPTFALRIRAAGRCLGYSADTAFDPDLIAWLSAADLLVHETNIGIHTPYAKLAALPAELRRKMRLIHYPDDFDGAGSGIEPLAQGQAIEV